MKSYEPPTKEFFRLPNKIFQVPLDATQFKLYSYFICCSGSKGYCWPTQYSPFTMAEARQDVSKMLDEHEEEPRSVRERLRNHQQEQTTLRKKEKDRDR